MRDPQRLERRFDHSGALGVVFGSGDGKIHLVDSNGKPRMAYVTGDEVQHVAAADLDGDGLDEILAGSLNYNVYCFDANARRRWRVDVGGPVSALAPVAQQRGACVIVGADKGRLATIDAAGAIQAKTELGAEVLDILPVPGSVIVATADGQLRRIAISPDGHDR